MKQLIIFTTIIFCFTSCVVQTANPGYWQPVYYGPTIGLGTIIAVVISWNRNHSILLAIICGILGWLYIIYAIIFPKK